MSRRQLAFLKTKIRVGNYNGNEDAQKVEFEYFDCDHSWDKRRTILCPKTWNWLEVCICNEIMREIQR